MSKKPFHPPSLRLAAQNLLADFVCSPVSMRGDRLLATVSDLFAATKVELQPRSDYASDDDSYPWEEPIYTVDRGVARVNVAGPLVKGYDDFTCWYFGMMSIDRLQSAIAEIGQRSDVRAAFLRINSPGGVSLGMPETADSIRALDAKKPVYGFTSDNALSNGYRIAAACRGFFATRSANVGCIGTYLALYDRSEQLAQMGIKLELFRDGALKGIGVVGKALTEQEKQFLDQSVLRSGAVFKDFVRAQRPDVTDETMQGQWFDGELGYDLGLVDAVAESEAAVLAKL